MSGQRDVATLVPRAYQDEIFGKALERNVIASLATGSGKTLIAVLLIRHISTLPSYSGKKIFFLVPKVPLVEQQTRFVEDHTQGLRVKGYVGSMDVDLWNKTRWKEEINDHDVLVMTPAILLRLLGHAYIAIPELSLLVYDEAHHARGNHPYAQIMRDHYWHSPKHLRPRVFAMTASPIWSPKNPEKDIQEIEGLLDGQLISVHTHKAELNEHSLRPDLLMISYVQRPIPPGYPSLWEELVLKGILPDFIEDADTQKALQGRFDFAREALGPLAANKYLYDFLSTKLHALSLSLESLLVTTELTALRNRIGRMRRFLEGHATSFDVFVPLNHTTVTHKVWRLVELLNWQNLKTKNLQAVIFAERRDIVKALSWLLPRLESAGWMKCDSIVGHGNADDAAKGMPVNAQKAVVQDFRAGTCNILVASSVAEEGLDFQSLSVVVKFDEVKTIVSYAQSRGRARKAGSMYCVMVLENDTDAIHRFKTFVKSEAGLMEMLSVRNDDPVEPIEEDEPSTTISPTELRSRYVTSAGAILTYSSAVILLSELCALIPSDEFTTILQPVYVGDSQKTVTLPAALPIPREHLSYIGPKCETKSEAKRAVAFQAVRNLHQLGVFDDHLLPIREAEIGDVEDADGRIVTDACPEKMMDVLSFTAFDDPWNPDSALWLHPILLDGELICGLVTATNLRNIPMLSSQEFGTIQTAKGFKLHFADAVERQERLELMANYSAKGSYWGITIKPFDAMQAAAFIIPIDKNTYLPDIEQMLILVRPSNPLWTTTTHMLPGTLLARHRRKHRAMRFVRVREDLTPHSMPLRLDHATPEEKYASYLDYYNDFYGKGDHGPPLLISENDLMLEFIELRRSQPVLRRIKAGSAPLVRYTSIIPHSACATIPLALPMYYAFTTLPALIRHIMGHVRAQFAIPYLKLPPLQIERLVEASTLPLVCAGFDYQRLETLGDSCLKLATTVHIFNRFPNKHEGQLSPMRRNSISNKYLRGRALEQHLELVLNCERAVDGRGWVPPVLCVAHDTQGRPLIPQDMPRKALQDCMEAILGASWLYGGMAAVLQTGTSLNLCFGGIIPWSERYPARKVAVARPTRVLESLMDIVGYRFTDVWLLVEALTHPSCKSKETCSYNRLEFLGDAVVDTFVMDNIFKRFPNAPPSKLTWARSAAVCNQTLAALALRELSLDKCVLHASSRLILAFEQAEVELASLTYAEIVSQSWKLNPAKALGDLFESLIGAIFVDSHFNLELTFGVLDRVMAKVLPELHPDLPLDPVSEFLEYVAKEGCTKIKFVKSEVMESGFREFQYVVLVHGKQVIEPRLALNKSLAKGLASHEALQTLKANVWDLKSVCTCAEDAQDMKDSQGVQGLLNRLGDDPDMDEITQELKRFDDDDEEVAAVKGMLFANANADVVAVGYETGSELDKFVPDLIESAATKNCMDMSEY